MPDRELNHIHDNDGMHNNELLSPEEINQIDNHERMMSDKIEFENQKLDKWNLEEPK